MIEPLNPHAPGYFIINSIEALDIEGEKANAERLRQLDENEIVEFHWSNATLVTRAGTALAWHETFIEESER